MYANMWIIAFVIVKNDKYCCIIDYAKVKLVSQYK